MSPRAAWRLEQLGFTSVYDYVPGKGAWLAAGLGVEGDHGPDVRAGSVARRDVPTCGLDELVGDVRGRVGDWPVVVVADDGVVLGVVRREDLASDPTTPVAEVMRSGPSTFRPSITCAELSSYLSKNKQPRTLITTLDGRLVGLVTKADLDACAERSAGG